jgi:hypothetical protein
MLATKSPNGGKSGVARNIPIMAVNTIRLLTPRLAQLEESRQALPG